MLPIVRGDGTLRGGSIEFFKRRARRILPPYFFSLALSLLLIVCLIGRKTGTTWDVSIPVTLPGLLAHLFLLHDLFGQYSFQIDYPLWSIAVEWHIYLLFPLLVLAWKRLGGVTTTTVAVVVSGLVFKKLNHTAWDSLHPHLYALFAVGMLGSAIVFSNQPPFPFLRTRIRWTIVFGGLCITFLLCYAVIPKLTKHVEIMDFFVGICAVSLLVAATHPGRNSLRHFLNWRPLVFVGTFSYSLYLIHAPLIQVIWQIILPPLHLGNTITFGLLVVIGSSTIIVASYLFFLVCERPYLNQARKA